MRDSKRRARQWIAEETKTKKPRTGSTRQETAVPKPPSQVLYIIPLWEKPSDMERIAVDCLIKAKSVRKGATELGVHRQTLSDAMGRMRCAALPVTQCRRQPRMRRDATRRRRQAGARRAFYFLVFAAVATSRVKWRGVQSRVLVESPLTTGWMSVRIKWCALHCRRSKMKLKPWRKRKPVCRTQLSFVSLVRHGGNCLSVATVTLFEDLLKMLNRSVPLLV